VTPASQSQSSELQSFLPPVDLNATAVSIVRTLKRRALASNADAAEDLYLAIEFITMLFDLPPSAITI
jgi:hypothetical protein